MVVLEDQRLISDLLCAFAANLPKIEVVGEAYDGRQALELCLEKKPDLVLFEMYLPGLNGIEILRQYGSKNPRARFVAISSQFTPDTVRDLLELGCHGIVSTSASASRLKESLQEVANGGAYLCSDSANLLRKSRLLDSSKTQRKNRLSNREREILQVVAEGNSTKQIAALLGVSVKTIEAHRANLMKKLEARSAVELTRCAFELGIIEPLGQGKPQAYFQAR